MKTLPGMRTTIFSAVKMFVSVVVLYAIVLTCAVLFVQGVGK